MRRAPTGLFFCLNQRFFRRLGTESRTNTVVYKQRRTSRNINVRLRFRVLQRDNFKCCACGASPAKDVSVELHVDHILPWSKGGETVFENLQTLCSKCNLGKSDMEQCSVYGILDTTFSPAGIPFFIFPARGSRKNPYRDAIVGLF